MITFVALPNKGCSTGMTETSAAIANNTNDCINDAAALGRAIRKRPRSY